MNRCPAPFGASLVALFVLLPWFPAARLPAQIVGPSTGGAAALAQADRMVGHTKRVLMIAAHPDDEDTELLTYLVRHEGAEAAYLSLTRGEGGQNLLGAELGEALGLLRTEELLAARQLDGARQFFTRAFDFGFSKSMAETLRFWPADTVLKDVVRIVRRFRPQIIVSIFSGTARDGHGQHQAAGWAAREAFRAAGDPSRFAELAAEEGLAPWQPTKLYRSTRFDTTGTTLVLDGGTLDPEIGQSYHQIAMRGRSRHRSQDMGALQEIGPSPIRLALEHDRSGAGAPLFAGVDTMPPPPGDSGIAAIDQARHAGTAASIRAGIVVDAIADASRLVPGQVVQLRLSIWNAGTEPVAGRIELARPVGWRAESECLSQPRVVPAGAVRHCRVDVAVPASAGPTVPYFLVHERAGALYRWTGDPRWWGESFDPPLLTARFAIETAAGDDVVLDRPVRERVRDQAVGEVRQHLRVVPALDVAIMPPTKVWPLARRDPEPFTVIVRSHTARPTTGTVHLDLPAGWAPVRAQRFSVAGPGERRVFAFAVRPPAGFDAGTFTLRAYARDSAGTRHDVGVRTVRYPHITERSFVRAATTRVEAASIVLPRVARVGYVRGASDRVPEALTAVGLDVEVLDAAGLERGDLDRYGVIVIGSRAYETDSALVDNNARLLDWVRDGGHLVVQYQQHAFFEGGFAPRPLRVARRHDRVTDETAPVRLLAPDHSVLSAPNRIGPDDWSDWVQERGLYFPSGWDDDYRPLIETHDPGAKPLEGGLLVARVGKGTYVYTALSFFRQLPAGVPGAFRLFLNLLEPRPRGALP